jgi:hypothetical protein
MHGGLPHRPGNAVVPQFKPGVARRAIALRGNQRPHHRDLVVPWHDRFDRSGVVVPSYAYATEGIVGAGRSRLLGPGRLQGE